MQVQVTQQQSSKVLSVSWALLLIISNTLPLSICKDTMLHVLHSHTFFYVVFSLQGQQATADLQSYVIDKQMGLFSFKVMIPQFMVSTMCEMLQATLIIFILFLELRYSNTLKISHGTVFLYSYEPPVYGIKYM